MQQTKVLETWVGLFVALGILALFFMAMKVSNLADLKTDDKSYRVTARFQNAGSLKERSAVSMAGVRIGRVSAIRFDKETYEAVVEMQIDPQYNTIPSDSSASVLTAGLLGEQYVGLSAGGSDEFLKAGDKIELTQSALVLEEVISRFLFNKAEGGSDKAEKSNSPAQADSTPSTSIPEAVTEKPKQAVKKAEETATHKAKTAEESEETGGKSKHKTTHSKEHEETKDKDKSTNKSKNEDEDKDKSGHKAKAKH